PPGPRPGRRHGGWGGAATVALRPGGDRLPPVLLQRAARPRRSPHRRRHRPVGGGPAVPARARGPDGRRGPALAAVFPRPPAGLTTRPDTAWAPTGPCSSPSPDETGRG